MLCNQDWQNANQCDDNVRDDEARQRTDCAPNDVSAGWAPTLDATRDHCCDEEEDKQNGINWQDEEVRHRV